MVEVKPYRLGVVEGFFGKSWSWEARGQYARFLGGNGFTTYLYAPKNDAWFRKQWHQASPQPHLDALTRLASRYSAAGVEFAIGLSPFELYLDFSDAGRDALARKLEEIDAIDPDTLCILFDDMQGDVADLARTQLRIMEFVTRRSKASRFMFCPTYYSDDPVLAAHFGAMPQGYLEEIGGQLDSRIDIFWTGPKVISQEFPEQHLLDVAERLHRKPLLWDNYPVNDSRSLAGFLHLRPPARRGPALKQLAQGHMANPMNQAFLSQLPLYALSRLYQGDTDAAALLEEAISVLCGSRLAPLVAADVALFQDRGLAALSDSEKAALIERYTPHRDHPVAAELCAWLRGDYAFDPACLT